MLGNVISFDCNGFRSAAVTVDGALYVWGNDHITGDSKKLFFNTTIPAEPTKILKENCKAVWLGDEHMAIINISNTLYMWGKNTCGEVGNGNRDFVATPVKVLEHVKDVSLGHDRTATITENGDLYVWGDNSEHYMVADENAPKLITEPYKLMEHVQSVAVYRDVFSAVTENGELMMWGHNNDALLGDKTKIDKKVPFQLADGISHVSISSENVAICSKDGSFYIWGMNEMYQIGDGTNDFVYTAKLIPIPDEVPSTPSDETDGTTSDEAQNTESEEMQTTAPEE